MPQVRIELDDEWYVVLKQYAEEEIRDASGQALWLVREALRERVKYAQALRHLAGVGSLPVSSLVTESSLLPSEEEQQIFGSHPLP